MNFILKLTTGSEVIFDGPARPAAPMYYGGPPPETGRWHVDLAHFEDFCAAHLATLSFGASIDTFIFGLEIAELQGWGEHFAATAHYTSHRPRMRALVSVGQIEWSEVKHLDLEQQLEVLWESLLSCIDRLATMKRKPRDFDAEALATAVRILKAGSHPPAFEIACP